MSDWYQQALTPPEVVQVDIRVGVIAETDHVQALVEMQDPMTKVLIAQASLPHDTVANLPHVLDWARSKALQLLNDHVEPF